MVNISNAKRFIVGIYQYVVGTCISKVMLLYPIGTDRDDVSALNMTG